MADFNQEVMGSDFYLPKVPLAARWRWMVRGKRESRRATRDSCFPDQRACREGPRTWLAWGFSLVMKGAALADGLDIRDWGMG